MLNAPVDNVLVIGAGSGMGRAVALELARAGRRVLAADLDLAAARETAELIARDGGRGRSGRVDVSDSSSVAALFSEVKSAFERLDFLVHTAAILGLTAFIEDVTDEDWRKMTAVNLDGAFFVCREAVRWMKETGGGRIVLFSSVASLTPTPGALPYSTAKGGVNMLARTLALEVSKHNIRVNVIAPGYIETPMLEDLPDGFGDYIVKKTPLRRLGRVEEIAGLAAWLATPEADFITGQIFSPNGGLVI